MSNKPKAPGLSLLDIGPVHEDIPYAGEHLRVYGVSAKGVFMIFQRFPQVATWFQGGKIEIRGLIEQAPEAIAAIVAAATGAPGNVQAEAMAEMMNVDSQLDVLEAAGRLTFKNGFGPFVKRIVALAAAARSENYGRATDTKSPPTSKPESQPGTPPTTPGT